MPHHVTVLPQQQNIEAAAGENLMHLLRREGFVVDAPCGGEGRCGKCKVLLEGKEVLACRTTVDRDMTVTLPEQTAPHILADGIPVSSPAKQTDAAYSLAFDIGTTTVVGFLLDSSDILSTASVCNPQISFGADVVSRIRYAVQNSQSPLTDCIQDCLRNLTLSLCRNGGVVPEQIRTVSVVGNPAMQQFLLGIPIENLAKVPFFPALTVAGTVPAGEIIPVLKNAQLLVIPDIAGFIGADTVACILATGMDQKEELTLLVDIGTNGEMVLGNRSCMVACSAAAGPALEGAGITFGMRGQAGAIDHVWLENGQLQYSVIGNEKAAGICGSGLIDAIAVALESGWLNARGKILTEDSRIHLTADIYLTQDDVRQVQLAKGAIAAGIHLMAAHMGISLQDIQNVLLAGAFGTYMNPRSACRIGLLPAQLEDRIAIAGNAAGSGAKRLASTPDELAHAQKIAASTKALELSTLSEFSRCFARNMRF